MTAASRSSRGALDREGFTIPLPMFLAMVDSVEITTDFSGWIVLALMLPGTIVIVGAVLAFILRRRNKNETPELEVGGYYRVLGVDAETGHRRESLYHANSRAGAEGRARMEGIVATEIHLVNEGNG